MGALAQFTQVIEILQKACYVQELMWQTPTAFSKVAL